MGARASDIVRTLISEEVRRVVGDAVGNETGVSARASAAEILRTYPNSGLGEDEIAEEISAAASAASVPLDELPSASNSNHADGTKFGALFVQSEVLYTTLGSMISDADGPIDPAAIAGKLVEKIPNLEFTKSELELVVRNVASVAGRPTKSTQNEPAKVRNRMK